MCLCSCSKESREQIIPYLVWRELISFNVILIFIVVIVVRHNLWSDFGSRFSIQGGFTEIQT